LDVVELSSYFEGLLKSQWNTKCGVLADGEFKSTLASSSYPPSRIFRRPKSNHFQRILLFLPLSQFSPGEVEALFQAEWPSEVGLQRLDNCWQPSRTENTFSEDYVLELYGSYTLYIDTPDPLSALFVNFSDAHLRSLRV
jgi:hypothetical protein